MGREDAPSLTPRQVAILDYACRSLRSRGFMPPPGEIGASLGCGAGVIWTEYRRLAALGYAGINPHGVRMYLPTRTPDGRPFTRPHPGDVMGAAS